MKGVAFTSWLRAPKTRLVALWGVSVLGAMAVTGVAGYYLGRAHLAASGDLILPVQLPSESYRTDSSFSEIANAKNELEVLCGQLSLDLRMRHYAHLGRPLAGLATQSNSDGNSAPQPLEAIRELEDALQELQGINAEMRIIQELLWAFARENLVDRWLDLYLQTLYQHPAEPLIALQAQTAWRMAYASGRQDDLAEAGQFLRLIPSCYAPGRGQQDTLAWHETPDDAWLSGN